MRIPKIMDLRTQDVVVINVRPKNEDDEKKVVECPLCGGDISKKNMKNSCSKRIEGHDVCNSCYNGLSQSYYEDGAGCIYCGDKKTKKTPKKMLLLSMPVLITTTRILWLLNEIEIVVCATEYLTVVVL